MTTHEARSFLASLVDALNRLEELGVEALDTDSTTALSEADAALWSFLDDVLDLDDRS